LVTQQFEQRTRELIDSLKAICAAYGLGNDGNEFKIITQVFLYKFLNDKFAFEAKKIRPELAKAESWEAAIAAMSADDCVYTAASFHLRDDGYASRYASAWLFPLATA